ncbi:MAG TPA: response regulator transcription factor [Spirochaetia bacterium]|nr:response regulator transcription factor [Spirochaetia bacterium]
MAHDSILVVEDDPAILTGLRDLLTHEGYAVTVARDGVTALALFKKKCPDVVLLDIMIPEKSGYDVLREIRRTDPRTPVLMLTAKGQEVDKVVGLELGADDYIVKPFGMQELLARIRAVGRRAGNEIQTPRKEHYTFGGVTINAKSLKGRRGDVEFSLSARELKLLEYFFAHRDEVLSREKILDTVWGMTFAGTTRTLDQHIAKLRRKIEDDPSTPRHILTVHTVGYRFQE